MLSLVELERVATVLSDGLVGGRIERWLEPDHGRIVFSIYRRGDPAGTHSVAGTREATGANNATGARNAAGTQDTTAAPQSDKIKCVIDLDSRPEIAHVGLIERMPKAPANLPSFAAYLRAHLSRARLLSVALRGRDRQLALRFAAESGEFVLLLCLFGRRSNLYLLDAQDRLVLALRPLAETRSELALGQPYIDPGGGVKKEGEDRFEGESGLPMLKAIAALYEALLDERSSGGDRRRLLNALKKERKSSQRRVERIEAELTEAEQANTLQRHGELLKANLSRIVSGKSVVVVEDFETGEPVEIRVDPKLSAKQNLEATFKRYQKLLRRLTKAGGQVESARAGLQEILDLEAEIEAAETLEEILTRNLVVRLLARHPGRQASGKGTSLPSKAIAEKPSLPAVYRDRPRKLHPRRYRSKDGLEIWVGRSDEGNDFLTTRFARGKDLFFHLDGAPGSHVILRTEGREDPPSESVLDACELAIHFSKQKNAGRADVHVVPIKNVKKPKGAKRGLVYVTGGKSVNLRREAARLERLQNSRIED